MKKYVVIFLFNKEKNKILLMTRKKPPYINCNNGIGGKIEENETVIDACIRECYEEIGVRLTNPVHHVTHTYPETAKTNAGTQLNVLYDFIDEIDIPENYEGEYNWYDIDFALDFNNKKLAGYANIALLVREILINEGIIEFY